MKAVINARVSTKEQEETGYSLDSQEKLLKEYATQKGFSFGKPFRISESASGKVQRKTFNEMIEHTRKNEINVILCEKTDRLTRNLKDAYLINEWINESSSHEVHFVKENVILNKESKSNEKFIWNIKVSVAQYYIDNLSEEVRKGQKEKIAQGWYPSRPPLGYISTGDKGKRLHVIDTEKAPLIKKVFELYGTGIYSLEKVAQLIREEGLRSSNGNQLNKRRVYEILRNPYYSGRMQWNGKVYPAKHEAIISIELFERVQSLLSGKTTPKNSKIAYVYKGMIRCSSCGGVVTWEKHKGIWYGHCNYSHSGCKDRNWIKETEIDDRINSTIKKLTLNNPRITEWIRLSLLESHNDEVLLRKSKVEEITKNLKIISNKLDRLYDDRLSEIISTETYQRKAQELNEEKNRLNTELSNVSTKDLDYKQLSVEIFDLTQNLSAAYSRKSLDDKKKLLKLLCKSIEKVDSEIVLKLNPIFEILMTAVVQTNSSRIPEYSEKLDKILEPIDFGSTNAKGAELAPLCAIWRPRPDSNWRPPQ